MARGVYCLPEGHPGLLQDRSVESALPRPHGPPDPEGLALSFRLLQPLVEHGEIDSVGPLALACHALKVVMRRTQGE
eukprot:scaffold404919_cov47-Prasinocladus_malaysianus.AAC.2